MTGIVAQNVGRTSGLIKSAGGGGVWTLIKTLTASSSSTLSFVDGTSDVVLDSTYPIYVFKFNNIHLGTDCVDFQFNFSVDGGSNYNVTKTTTSFPAYHSEDDTYAAMAYNTGNDLAQGTGFQNLSDDSSADADHGQSGTLYLFSPSSTVFVKHFIARLSTIHSTNMAYNWYYAGYGNTTSAVDAIQFKMSSGNIDAGKIKLYGLSDS
jgi:hypothetical protein